MIKLKYLVILCTACTVLQAQNIAEISSTYRGSENAIVRKQALRNLSTTRPSGDQKNIAVSKANTNEQQVITLIRDAFKDPNATVVEEAIFEAGELRLLSTDNDLNSLYQGAGKHFGAYTERIEYAIFTAAGKIGGEVSKKLLLDALKGDNGSYSNAILFSAFKQMNDPSTVESLIEFAQRMDAIVNQAKQRGADPMLYTNALSSAANSREVATFLSNGKAGN